MRLELTNVDLNAPIGVFDSGFGGLTVARAVVDLLPDENIIYLGDTARAPYGPRPIAQVREFALEGLDWLHEQGVKALVIACNSASSAVIRDARERYDVPVIEVIMPASQKAAATTRNSRIGIISTQATYNSRAYYDALGATSVKIYSQVCPRFVEFVENARTSGKEVMATAEDYLAPLKAADIDTLILGCTHYPLLSGVISYVMGEGVNLVSSSDECARATFAKLTARELLRTENAETTRRFVTTGDPARFQGLGARLMGGFVADVEQIHF